MCTRETNFDDKAAGWFRLQTCTLRVWKGSLHFSWWHGWYMSYSHVLDSPTHWCSIANRRLCARDAWYRFKMQNSLRRSQLHILRTFAHGHGSWFSERNTTNTILYYITSSQCFLSICFVIDPYVNSGAKRINILSTCGKLLLLST